MKTGLAQGCPDVSGTWQVDDQSTIIYNIAGQIQTQPTSGSGPLPIQQNGCQISFVSEGINPLDGSIIRMPRTGTVTGNTITYSGETGVIIPGASCSQNQITGRGLITGDTMQVTNTGIVQCSVQGIPILVTIDGVSVFTRPSTGLTLSGEVRLSTPTGPPMAGVTVRLNNGAGTSATALTDASGGYAFASLQPGTYTVTPEQPGYRFAPADQTVQVAQSTALNVFVGSPASGLRITRVWSHQLDLPRGECNFLPPADPLDLSHSSGAGRVGNTQNYLLMGARDDGYGYVKARVALDPPDPALQSRITVRLARADDPNRTPVGNPPVFTADEALLTVNLNTLPAPANAMAGFVVIGWIDLNQNGTLDAAQGEVLVETQPRSVLLIVPPAHYAVARQALTLGAIQDPINPVNGTKHPIAADFLYAFTTGVDPSLATRRLDSSICTRGELDFNTGSQFAIDGCGFIYEYEFSAASRVGRAILKSRALRQAAAFTLALNRQRIQDEFQAHPNERMVLCDLIGNQIQQGVPTGSLSLSFGNADQDLGLSFGTATLTDAYLFVLRDDPNNVEVRGRLVDLYDWNYEEGFFDRLAAAVQAGYPTLGPGGRVFRLNAFFDGPVPGIRFDGIPTLAISQATAGAQSPLMLTISGRPGAQLAVQRSTTLDSSLNSWTPFTTLVLSNAVADVEIPVNLTEQRGFFRVVTTGP